MAFANTAATKQTNSKVATKQTDSNTTLTNPSTASETRRRVDLELLHARLGHQSIKSLLAASHDSIWEDTQIRFAPDSFCISCKIATRRTVARGHRAVSHPEYPGQILFMDLIHNPSQTSITASTYYQYYLLIVCAYSRYGVLVGCHDSTSKTIITCITNFSVYHRPHLSYTLQDVAEIHVDAGTYFTSAALKQWAQELNIAVIIPGAHHQEMNGLCERRWQAIRLRAFCIMNHARLTHAFMHFSLSYSSQITAVLPLRGLFIKDDQGQDRPCSPYELYYSQKPRIGRFRVFGCPIVAKCYIKKHPVTRRNFDDRSIIQRGIRAIFLGFPLNQAGYIYWQPNTGDLGTSVDVSFDEYFHSSLAYSDLIFHDALPTRNPAPHANAVHANASTVAFTGAPLNVPDDNDPSEPWTPFTAISPELGPSDTQEVDPQTFKELAALPDSIILNMDDLPTLNKCDIQRCLLPGISYL